MKSRKRHVQFFWLQEIRRLEGLGDSLHGFPTLSAPGIPRYFQKGKWIIATAEVMGLLRFFLGFPEVFKIVTFLNFLPWNLFGINKKHEDIHFDPAAMVEIPSCCLPNVLAHGFFY